MVIEAARIDHASHGNDIVRVIPEVKELSDGVNMIVSDHEIGGLGMLTDNTGVSDIARILLD